MENSEKMKNLLEAIDSVHTMDDGSVRIKWKANVFHDVGGFYGTHSIKELIMSSDTAVHLNPDLDVPILDIDFDFVEDALSRSIECNLKLNLDNGGSPYDCGCDQGSY